MPASIRLGFVLLGLWVIVGQAARAGDLKAGAAAVELIADDSMVIGGGIGPQKYKGQEGKLRASAIVVEDPSGNRIALVECDVLMVNRDILDWAAHEIEKLTNVPFDHILINATHTHHAPTTVTVHWYHREEAFTRQVGEKSVEAVVAAAKRLTPVEMVFRLGEESSVGQNSRILLQSGMIYWTGPRKDLVRPTGPFDPDLPVWAFKKPDGWFEAIMFNHSTHTIGAHKPLTRSPSFYGMAAQGLEAEKGGTVLFFEGASGSTHNLELPGPEMTLRITKAVDSALNSARPMPVSKVRGIRSEFPYKIRTFDDAMDDVAVLAYEERYIKPIDAKGSQFVVDTFRAMRKELAPLQGQERKTWIQAVKLGDTAIVGIPGECFT